MPRRAMAKHGAKAKAKARMRQDQDQDQDQCVCVQLQWVYEIHGTRHVPGILEVL